MPKREVTSIRQAIGQQAKFVPDLAGQVLPVVEKIHQASQETKIGLNLTNAQLEINDITNQYRIDNESNPTKNTKEYNTQIQGVFKKYGEDISPMYKGQWSNKANQLIGQTKVSQQTWGIKQNAENTLFNLEQGMERQKISAYEAGKEFAVGDSTDIEKALEYEQAATSLEETASGIFGSETTAGIMGDFEVNQLTSFLSGVTEVNPDLAKSYLDEKFVKEILPKTSMDKIKADIIKSDKQFQKVLVDSFKNEMDAKFAENPYEFFEESKDRAKSGAAFRQEKGIKRDGYEQIRSYGEKLRERHKDNVQFDYYDNPTEEGLKELQALNPDMKDAELEKLTEMWEETPDYEATTSFRGLDNAMSGLIKLANSNTDKIEDKKIFVNKTVDFMSKVLRSNTGETKQGVTMSTDDIDKVKKSLDGIMKDKLVREVIADMPDGTAFSRIMDKTLLETETTERRGLGIIDSLKTVGLAATVLPRGIISEHKKKDKIEKISLHTSQQMLNFALEGDKEGMNNAYEEGIEKAIRAKYYYIPEMQGKLKEDVSIVNISGKPYLFKGWGAEDVLLERMK